MISAMPPRTVRTMCPMNCHPTFCGMLVEVSEKGRLLRVRGDQDNPDSRASWAWREAASGRATDLSPRGITSPI